MIDAHQHFWTTARDDYGWLSPDDAVLYRDFGPPDLAPLIAEAGITQTVLVQAAPTLAETRYLLGIADATDWVGAVVGWAPLSAGVLTGKYTRGGAEESLRKGANDSRGRTSEKSLLVAREVDAVADELGVSSAQVALAWVQAQGYRYIPIVGARKVSQIQDSLGAPSVTLGEEHVRRLNEISSISMGFPHDFLASGGVQDLVKSESRNLLDERPRRS